MEIEIYNTVEYYHVKKSNTNPENLTFLSKALNPLKFNFFISEQTKSNPKFVA